MVLCITLTFSVVKLTLRETRQKNLFKILYPGSLVERTNLCVLKLAPDGYGVVTDRNMESFSI